jgi:hypothetical protein
MSAFEPQTYGPAVAELLAGAPLNELGPGEPGQEAKPRLAALTPESVASPRPMADRRMALLCIAGLWLRYDFAHEAHAICQDIETPDGSYWHAIVHRREPDFDNAKYWFRRVSAHPILAQLHADSRQFALESPPDKLSAFLQQQTKWDAFRFVDLCQAAFGGPPPLESLCRRIQQREWELLFDHCHQRAAG